MIVTSVFSGLSVGFLGMGPTLLIGVGALTPTLLHLLSLRIPERRIATADEVTGWVDLRGGWLAVVAVPGLVALVLFTTVNNLFSGAAMAVMDPYGIEMFGVQGWGIWFAVMSTGFIVGGSVVALKGLGRNPIRTMLVLAAAAPITTLLVAPLAELWIIPALRTDAGTAHWAPVLGSGHNRGSALLLLATGIGCIILAGIAALTPQYRLLSRRYAQTGA